MNLTRLTQALLFSIVCFMFQDVAAAESVVKKVERHTLALIPWQDEDWPQESFNDYLNRCMRYQKNPQEFKKRRSAFKVLAAAECPTDQVDGGDDTTTWTDLCLFSGKNQPHACLVETINRCATNLGKTCLACIIAQPTTDTHRLRERQNLVQHLINSPDLFAQMDANFKQMAACENLMLSFWLHDPLDQSASRHYFNIPGLSGVNDILNRNDIALEVHTLLEHKLRLANALTSVAAAIVLPMYALAQMQKQPIPPDMEQFAQELRRGGTLVALLAYGLSKINNPEVKAAASRGATFGDGILYGFSIKGNFEWAWDNIVLEMCLQEKMIDVAGFVRGMKGLESLIAQDPVCSNFACAHQLHALCTQLPAENEQLQELFDLLETDTFKGQARIFSRKGRVLAAYRLMHRLKDTFTKALAAVAELDAYLSVAKLYKEFEHQRVRYCFVNYKEADRPYIALDAFWNPLVSAQLVVPNNLCLDGGSGRANVILTGPNAGGKSTVLKAVGLSLIMAQTIGIAPASSMTITPLHTIATYLNITDDIASGNSLFKAEVLRASALVEKVEALKGKEFSFVAIDEMFSGTSPEEGRAAAYSVAKHMGKFTNNICMIATHYPQLTNLAKDTSYFANYKVTVNIDKNRSITYPFKLEPGISDQHVAIDILRSEGFDSQILDDADALVRGN